MGDAAFLQCCFLNWFLSMPLQKYCIPKTSELTRSSCMYVDTNEIYTQTYVCILSIYYCWVTPVLLTEVQILACLTTFKCSNNIMTLLLGSPNCVRLHDKKTLFWSWWNWSAFPCGIWVYIFLIQTYPDPWSEYTGVVRIFNSRWAVLETLD